MNVNFGKGVKKEIIFKDLMNAMQVVSLAHPLLLTLVYFLAPLLITEFFKKYIVSIDYLQTLLFMNLFLAHFILAFHLFLTINKQTIFLKYLVYYYVFVGFIYVLSSRLLTISSFPIIAVISNMVFSLFLFYILKKYCDSKIKFLKIIFVYMYPPVCFFVAIVFSNYVLVNVEAGYIQLFFNMVIAIGVYVVLIASCNKFYFNKIKIKLIFKKNSAG